MTTFEVDRVYGFADIRRKVLQIAWEDDLPFERVRAFDPQRNCIEGSVIGFMVHFAAREEKAQVSLLAVSIDKGIDSVAQFCKRLLVHGHGRKVWVGSESQKYLEEWS